MWRSKSFCIAGNGGVEGCVIDGLAGLVKCKMKEKLINLD